MRRLKLQSLSKQFGTTLALDAVTIELPERGLVLVQGPNGSGKSTLLDLVCGAVKPSSGAILLDGALMQASGLRRMCARLHQRNVVPSQVTFSELICVAKNQRRFMNLFTKLGRVEIESEARTVLASASIDPCASLPLSAMSGGQQRIAMLLATLATSRKVVLLDEPLAGLSESSVVATLELLKVRAQLSLVIVIDHESQGWGECADEYIRLEAGRLTRGHSD